MGGNAKGIWEITGGNGGVYMGGNAERPAGLIIVKGGYPYPPEAVRRGVEGAIRHLPSINFLVLVNIHKGWRPKAANLSKILCGIGGV